MGRLTIPDVRVDEHTTRRSVIDVAAVREHAMEFYWRLKAYEDMVDLETLNNTPISRLVELAEADKDGRVVVLAPEERTLDFPVKYTGICALYHFCVDLGIKCTIERLHDGYAVRFPDGSDFAQHHGTYGGTEGCVEPTIGDSDAGKRAGSGSHP